MMAHPRVARRVADSDLGSYQLAVRRVLSSDIITATRPRPGVLEHVLRWADEMSRDLRELLGYTLVATTNHVRLVRRLDSLDATQRAVFAHKERRFDRRRLAYLCLVLGSFQRSRVEISLADLIRVFTPAANAVDGLGFDPTVGAHKAAVVDVLGWLVDRGALRLSDGSLESWVRDTTRGDALFDIEHDVCALLFKPSRQLQHITSVAGLLNPPPRSGAETAQRARRLLVESPVAYYSALAPEIAEALRTGTLAEDMARLTGLVLERRAEGVLLADPSGTCTDREFPGRGVVSRAAGLILAKIADHLEEHGVAHLPMPRATADQADVIARVDAGLPHEGVVRELAVTLPDPPPRTPDERPATTGARLPFVEESRLGSMLDDLYDHFGATAFTANWRNDPRGLLAEVVEFLADMALLRPVPGGVLVLPAALRYRNITGALPARDTDGQLSLDLAEAPTPPNPDTNTVRDEESV